MADNNSHDNYGNFQDNKGTFYKTPDNTPPTHGSVVTVIENGQYHGGTFDWNSGTVKKD